METTNLFAGLPESLPDELTGVLLGNQHVRKERIVSQGHTSPDGFWCDQDEHQWVIVLTGESKLMFEHDGKPLHLKSGDHVLIQATRSIVLNGLRRISQLFG